MSSDNACGGFRNVIRSVQAPEYVYSVLYLCFAGDGRMTGGTCGEFVVAENPTKTDTNMRAESNLNFVWRRRV